MRAVTAGILLAGAAALAGCDRGADTGATSNPNAPGQPGSNPPVTAIPDSGSTNVSPGVGGQAGVQPVPGATGSGGTGTGPTTSTEPGTGTAGGLGGTNAVGAGPQQGQSGSQVPSGTTNTAPRDNVGGR